MKKMIYSTERTIEVLLEGDYLNHKFAIFNLGTHPTAYVECKISDCHGYEDGRLFDVEVHGGFTYYGELLHLKEESNVTYLGWDYAHFGDYMGYYLKNPKMNVLGEKRWTTEEIYHQVKFVIEQLIELEKVVM